MTFNGSLFRFSFPKCHASLSSFSSSFSHIFPSFSSLLRPHLVDRFPSRFSAFPLSQENNFMFKTRGSFWTRRWRASMCQLLPLSIRNPLSWRKAPFHYCSSDFITVKIAVFGVWDLFTFQETSRCHRRLVDKKAAFRLLPTNYLRFLAHDSPNATKDMFMQRLAYNGHPSMWHWRLAWFSNLNLTWKLSEIVWRRRWSINPMGPSSLRLS